MSQKKQIATRINSLLNRFTELLENHLDIRREILRIQAQLNSPDILEDIHGIRVYKGADFCDLDEPTFGTERIIIGEEIENDLEIESDSESDSESESEIYYAQDCGGNIVPITKIPNRFDGIINATFSISDMQSQN